MFRALHFETGQFEKRRVFLDDEAYGLALDCLVKACADVLVTKDGAKPGEKLLLLGCRRVEPQPDWWFIGGRSRPGDVPCEAAARNVKRELMLDLPAARPSPRTAAKTRVCPRCSRGRWGRGTAQAATPIAATGVCTGRNWPRTKYEGRGRFFTASVQRARCMPVPAPRPIAGSGAVPAAGGELAKTRIKIGAAAGDNSERGHPRAAKFWRACSAACHARGTAHFAHRPSPHRRRATRWWATTVWCGACARRRRRATAPRTSAPCTPCT